VPDLQPVDESWTTALCVVAHPDDLEFGTAAAVARWTDQGKTVAYVMVTSGEAGIDGMDPTEARQVREAEQIQSAKIVGVDAVDFLGLPDGVLEYGVDLRRAICAAVRRHKPEIVITNNFRDIWPGGALNQADHIATGRATLDAVRDAANRWVFHEQITGGLERWSGVREVWAAFSPEGKHAVETTQTFERGVASLAAHKAYIDGLGWEFFDPAEFLEGGARQAGTQFGVPMAASFEVFSMGFGT
jgi:LmbE family N-acetylglucosaminyl deacetylase